MTTRLVRWTGVLVAVLGLLVVSVVDRGVETEDQRIQRLHDSYACPVCDGQSVADSNASVAEAIRTFIEVEVVAGSSDDQIRDDILSAWPGSLLNPPGEGFAALVWVLPVVVAVVGAVGVAFVVGRRVESTAVSSADRDLVDAARREVGR